MSFKLPLMVGHFAPDSDDWITGRIDPDCVRSAIARSGGIVEESVTAEVLARRRNRLVLGYVDGESIVLHSLGYLVLVVGYGPHPILHRFLSCMCHEHGCELMNGNDGAFITDELLTQLGG